MKMCSGYVRYSRSPGHVLTGALYDIHDIKHDQSSLGLRILLVHLRHHSLHHFQHGQDIFCSGYFNLRKSLVFWVSMANFSAFLQVAFMFDFG